jgi:hypothetical protein
MKRLNRDINIFSMSALDLFASAMGTFILLVVVLFPYYLKNAEIVEKMSALRQELAKAQEQNPQLEKCQTQKSNLQSEIKTLKRDLKNCHQKLRQTFLAVVMKWETKRQDIDLHIIDPDNNEFYYKKHNRHRSHFPNVNAELSVDTIKGPGIEIWENQRIKQGLYNVYAKLYARKGNSKNPVVRTTIYYRDGSKKLPNITLHETNKKKLIATIEINAEGEVLAY